jgi:hypothetical protein
MSSGDDSDDAQRELESLLQQPHCSERDSAIKAWYTRVRAAHSKRLADFAISTQVIIQAQTVNLATSGGQIVVNEPTSNPGAAVWEKIVAFAMAAVVLLAVLVVVLRNEPFKDPNIVLVFRIVIAAAMGVFVMVVPGFLHVEWKGRGLVIRAGGAIAAFVLCLVFTPKVLPPMAAAADAKDNADANKVQDVSEKANPLAPKPADAKKPIGQ